MALAYHIRFPQIQTSKVRSLKNPNGSSYKAIQNLNPCTLLACLLPGATTTKKKQCLRCRNLYEGKENSPTACSFHGHTTGEKGLFSFAPPHQGIDGEWSDKSGVIVYKWNEKHNRLNTGSANWKKRWSCCGEYDENSHPCRQGWHVSYDDGFTLH